MAVILSQSWQYSQLVTLSETKQWGNGLFCKKWKLPLSSICFFMCEKIYRRTNTHWQKGSIWLDHREFFFTDILCDHWKPAHSALLLPIRLKHNCRTKNGPSVSRPLEGALIKCDYLLWVPPRSGLFKRTVQPPSPPALSDLWTGRKNLKRVEWGAGKFLIRVFIV